VSGGNKPVAWITGAGGLIGNELVKSATTCAADLTAVGLTHSSCDLLDFRKVDSLFRRDRPRLIIHCAAISRSTDSQGAPNLARRVNVEATRHLVELGADTPFIFFSTDLVFDGSKGNYLETDAVNPLSTYAETKVAAEEIVRLNSKHCILRISLTGGTSPKGDRGFNEEIKNAWREGETLNLFTDEFRCPTAAPVVARAVWELALKGPIGMFHLCGAEKLSRYQIGQLLAKKHPELNPKIVAASRNEYVGPPRPADTSMICSKVQEFLSFPLPKFSDWLKEDQSGF
jgi:dTDP-4-dehydrorhamnose reductase